MLYIPFISDNCCSLVSTYALSFRFPMTLPCQSRGAHPSSVTGSVTSQSQPQSSVATTVLLADTRGLSVEQNSVSASGTTVCPTIQVQSLLFCMLPLLQPCNESGKLRPAHVRPSNYCIGRAGYELQSPPAAAAAASGVDLTGRTKHQHSMHQIFTTLHQ